MELNIKTTVDQLNNGTTIHIYDSTLDYDATTNPGGWATALGGVNPMRTDVLSLVITIAKGDVTETLTYVDPVDIAQYFDPTHGFLLSSVTLFGATYDVFEDGIYTITVNATGTASLENDPAYNFDESDDIYEAFLWNLNDEIRHLVITIDVPIRNYLEAYNTSLLNTLFDAIIYNCQYGNVEKAQAVLDYLTDVMDNNTTLTELFKNFENYG